MRERNRNLVIRIDDTEHGQLRALAEAADVPAAFLVRRFIRDHYVAKFGEIDPDKALRQITPKR